MAVSSPVAAVSAARAAAPSAGRDDVSFRSGGEPIAAWFYHAVGASSPAPCVVMGHGFAAVKEARLDAFAERFAAAGLSCLVFDYRHFGASGGEPRQIIDLRRQREDWRAALRFARSLGGVDAARIGVWGTSLGGGLALEVAATEPGIAAAVFHLPLVDALAAGLSEGIAHDARLAWAALCDLGRSLVRRRPYLIAAVGPHGALAFMDTPGSEPGYLAIVRDAPTWRNAVAARVFLGLAFFRPVRLARRVRCPALFVIGERDVVTPPGASHRAARLASAARVYALPVGHFDAYLGDAFEETVAVEAAFLSRQLGAREALDGGFTDARA
ncbi:MAG: alpha/beta hydrolase [Dehalococcoidia bacterium]